MSRYRTGNKQYYMVVSRSEICLYISLLCVYTSHPTEVCYHCFKCWTIVMFMQSRNIIFIYIQLINNENILDDWASQMRKYHRNETVMIYLITLIVSQVSVSSQTFYPSVNSHVFWQKKKKKKKKKKNRSNGIFPLCHCLCPVAVVM